MNSRVVIRLDLSHAQEQRLLALQAAFAQVCNALAPLVQSTRTWNRVALHHLAYKSLREQFPSVGSQMVCNAIYSVSRHCRSLFQGENSPYNLSKLAGQPLPLVSFADTCPVFFDRHTLSLKDGQLSMYTLDGRIRFRLNLRPGDEASFHHGKLRELVLSRSATNRFFLAFTFSEPDAIGGGAANQVIVEDDDAVAPAGAIPNYLKVESSHANA